MSGREDLTKAYNAFRLPPGSSFSQIKMRYKTLVKLLHPDKHGGENAKKSAEEEIKFYNEQFERLRKHFQTAGEHIECGPCICRPTPINRPTPPPTFDSRTYDMPKSTATARDNQANNDRRENRRPHSVNLKVACLLAAAVLIGMTNLVLDLTRSSQNDRKPTAAADSFPNSARSAPAVHDTASGITQISSGDSAEADVVAIKPASHEAKALARDDTSSAMQSAMVLNQSIQQYKHRMIMLHRDANTLKTRLRSSSSRNSKAVESQLASKNKELAAVEEKFNKTHQQLTLLMTPPEDDSPTGRMPQLLPEDTMPATQE